MAGAAPPGIDAVEYAREVTELGAGEILLTSMDRDGAEERLRHRADPRGRRRGSTCRSSRRAASARSIISSPAFATAMRAPCSPRRSSISANIRSRRRSFIWPRPGLPMRLDGSGGRAMSFHARRSRRAHQIAPRRQRLDLLHEEPLRRRDAAHRQEIRRGGGRGRHRRDGGRQKRARRARRPIRSIICSCCSKRAMSR